jgi:predicted phage terminase large subunit-like protein
MEGGMIFFPIDAVWLDDLETELALFPNGAHDDQVDAMSYAAVWAQRSAGPVPLVKPVSI